MISKVALRNYRLFRNFDLEFGKGVNIIVGANDSGKSTLIEAINLALTGRIHGRLLSQGISPYLFNAEATQEFITALRAGAKPTPPAIVIEVYLEPDHDTRFLKGTNNLFNEDAFGIRLQVKLSPEFQEEYESFVAEPSAIRLVPAEYYRVDWLGFSGNAVTSRSVPAVASVIDPTSLHLQSGIDYHLQQILRTNLDAKERVELARQYRSLRETFSDKETVKAINQRLQSPTDPMTDRKLSIGIDISQRYTWESSLAAHLDDLPFALVGKGEQNSIKTLLALGRRANDANIVLIEEPETHLSFASLRQLISRIEKYCVGKQVIIATHSTFVLNKLGLANLVLISSGAAARISDLPKDTVEYFKKLAGFDTLRLVLAKGAILVEGPSDELIVQRAYRDVKGRLPIDDGVDVISVGLSHKRFLDIAQRLKRRVWVVTDNDGKTLDQVKARFKDYLTFDHITLHTGSDPASRTLEPQIVAVNELEVLNEILKTQFTSKAELEAAMIADKTSVALAIFEAQRQITMPQYIRDVIEG